MKIGVISDTHDNLASMQRALEIFKAERVEMIVHCGDWVASFAVKFFADNSGDIPVKGVFGNNEGDTKSIVIKNQKLAKPVEFAERKVLEVALPNGDWLAACHGEDMAMLEALVHSQKYRAVFCGHTHAVRNELVDGVRVINPGATCFAREGRIVDEATVAIYDSATNSAGIKSFPWPLDAKN
jgi:putative phosphoesterase